MWLRANFGESRHADAWQKDYRDSLPDENPRSKQTECGIFELRCKTITFGVSCVHLPPKNSGVWNTHTQR